MQLRSQIQPKVPAVEVDRPKSIKPKLPSPLKQIKMPAEPKHDLFHLSCCDYDKLRKFMLGDQTMLDLQSHTFKLTFSSTTVIPLKNLDVKLLDYQRVHNKMPSPRDFIRSDRLDCQFQRIIFKTLKIAGVDAIQIINESDINFDLVALNKFTRDNQRQDPYSWNHLKSNVRGQKILFAQASMYVYTTNLMMLKFPDQENYFYLISKMSLGEQELCDLIQNLMESKISDIELGKRRRQAIDLDTDYRDPVKRPKQLSQKRVWNIKPQVKPVEQPKFQITLRALIPDEIFYSKEAEEQCNICCEKIRQIQLTQLKLNVGGNSCAHVFCFDCIFQWATKQCNQCPLCRKNFNKLQRPTNELQIPQNLYFYELINIADKKQAINYQELIQDMQNQDNDNQSVDEDQYLIEDFFHNENHSQNSDDQQVLASRRNSHALGHIFMVVRSHVSEFSNSFDSYYLPSFSPIPHEPMQYREHIIAYSQSEAQDLQVSQNAVQINLSESLGLQSNMSYQNPEEREQTLTSSDQILNTSADSSTMVNRSLLQRIFDSIDRQNFQSIGVSFYESLRYTLSNQANQDSNSEDRNFN
ncbi:zinc c3hc4 type ring finger domain-containing protein [Stylonychia lemnae]|uniref:Zinc c3hc4 type ring finger domain-containing protein n=1 Tax=Stylonychia lemnae TaxID=5949 RepID=A0A077ZZN5_STYLE|nr:zinc c3hc4 type ring finger domain-containing protein [Stylonychia lemnae]|eukprot:CDW75391.1 zinc c3hc4 type ring finger domain-containing protein [Stylonychia lemnae]